MGCECPPTLILSSPPQAGVSKDRSRFRRGAAPAMVRWIAHRTGGDMPDSTTRARGPQDAQGI